MEKINAPIIVPRPQRVVVRSNLLSARFVSVVADIPLTSFRRQAVNKKLGMEDGRVGEEGYCQPGKDGDAKSPFLQPCDISAMGYCQAASHG